MRAMYAPRRRLPKAPRQPVIRQRRASRLMLFLAAVSLVSLVLLATGCGNELTGTIWEASMLGNDITLTFDDDETCTVEWGVAGMPTEKRSGSYAVEGDQITIGEGDEMMVLTRSGDTMTGSAQGVTLTFERQ